MKYASVPFNQNENGWLNETSRTPRYPTLNQNTDADWVVIGSGYAGLYLDLSERTLLAAFKRKQAGY